MKIAIIGATGIVGRRLVDEALDRGHTVTAIARRPEVLGSKTAWRPDSVMCQIRRNWLRSWPGMTR